MPEIKNKNNILDLCTTETYFDEKIGHNVTLIIDTEGSMSQSRQHANQRAKYLGYEDIYHLEGYQYFNRLENVNYVGYEVDILNLMNGGIGYGE